MPCKWWGVVLYEGVLFVFWLMGKLKLLLFNDIHEDPVGYLCQVFACNRGCSYIYS